MEFRVFKLTQSEEISLWTDTPTPLYHCSFSQSLQTQLVLLDKSNEGNILESKRLRRHDYKHLKSDGILIK